MKKIKFVAFLFVLFFLGFSTQEVKAQSATGVSSIGYDSATNLVSGYSATDLDYYARWYYDAYIEGYLYKNSVLMDSESQWTYGIAAVYTYTTGTMGSQYTVASDHYVVAYYDDSYGYYDYYGYDYLPGGTFGGLYGFYGSGPLIYTSYDFIYLGSTSVSVTLQSSPNVTISALDVVPKSTSFGIPVNVTLLPTGTAIKLKISKVGATPAWAQFIATGTQEQTITQSTTVHVQGLTTSSLVGDIKLEAIQVNNSQVLATKYFTVIYVTISMRNGNSDQISLDNSGRSAFINILGTSSLGESFGSGKWRHGVEIIGTVTPSSYGTTNAIVLRRETYPDGSGVVYKRYKNSVFFDSSPPFTDMSDDILRDDYPQSGGSNGKIYDLDSPALKSFPEDPIGTTWHRRLNFVQWANIKINGVKYKCSDFFYWYHRIGIQKTVSGDVIINTISQDNRTGVGLTSLNLNP